VGGGGNNFDPGTLNLLSTQIRVSFFVDKKIFVFSVKANQFHLCSILSQIDNFTFVSFIHIIS
jgi:hypothetical protein